MSFWTARGESPWGNAPMQFGHLLSCLPVQHTGSGGIAMGKAISHVGPDHIAEVNGRGVVSYISNNSWLEAGSHPVMRDHLLHAFDQIWIDNLHGNRLISERAPNGRTCETIFKRAGHSVGIKVGTAIGCMAKRGCSAERSLAEVSYRDVWGRPGTDESWGRAEEKRAALVESLAAADFAGLYQDVTPRRETRWVLIPGVSAPDYASWPALAERSSPLVELLATVRPAVVEQREVLIS